MKPVKIIAFFSSLLMTLPLWAQESIDERIDEAVRPIADGVAGFIFSSFPVNGVGIPYVLVWLLLAATIFTFYFGFINFRGFKHGFQLVRGDYTDPMAAGEVTHFQALATALSGTVGLGNIAGVAIAVSLGGPGATFWMILAGLLGMSSKFVECTLGVKYRNEYTDGTVSGGPMYYLSKGLKERSEKLAGLGKVLAVLFAIFCVGGSFGGGNMFQANQSFKQLVSVTGGDASWLADKGWLFGLIHCAPGRHGDHWWHQGNRPCDIKDCSVHGRGLCHRGPGHHHDEPLSCSGRFRRNLRGRIRSGGHRRRYRGRPVSGLQEGRHSHNEAGIGSAAIAHSARAYQPSRD